MIKTNNKVGADLGLLEKNFLSFDRKYSIIIQPTTLVHKVQGG